MAGNNHTCTAGNCPAPVAIKTRQCNNAPLIYPVASAQDLSIVISLGVLIMDSRMGGFFLLAAPLPCSPVVVALLLMAHFCPVVFDSILLWRSPGKKPSPAPIWAPAGDTSRSQDALQHCPLRFTGCTRENHVGTLRSHWWESTWRAGKGVAGTCDHGP